MSHDHDHVAAEPAAPVAEQSQTPDLVFPTPAGQGFFQINGETGWLWVGIHLPSFNFRTAWAFIMSRQYDVSAAYDKIDQERNVRTQLAAHKGNGGLKALASRLGIK